jgi:hypothetical protein
MNEEKYLQDLKDAQNDGCYMLDRIRRSLEDRLEGRNTDSDIEIMLLVDKIIVKAFNLGREYQKHLDDC